LRSKSLRFGGTAFLVLIALLGCSSKPGPDVMAKVNGKSILRSEVDKYYATQTAETPQKPTGQQAEALRLSILKELIDNEILAQRAEKDGLLATDDEVQRKFTEIKSPYTEEEFQKRLKDRHLSVDDLKLELRRSLTMDKVINKEITSKVQISDADIQAYYNDHKSDFNLIEPQYHLAHILVTVSPQPPPRNQKNSKAQNAAEAQKKIQELRNRLESGEDFAKLAAEWSEDPDTAPNGGDLGNIPESGLKNTDPGTRDAVMKLKPGQHTPIITLANPQTRQVFGYRIVRLIDKLPAGQRDLKDPRVQQFIRDRLRETAEQLRKAAFYEVLRSQAKVQNFYAEALLQSAGK
jgi:peptidyl-prolyl cis-trans isomerase SurA